MTNTQSPAERGKLAACPFCGKQMFEQNLGNNPTARCDTKGCWMHERALAIPLDDQRHVAAWNTRTPPQVDEAGLVGAKQVWRDAYQAYCAGISPSSFGDTKAAVAVIEAALTTNTTPAPTGDEQMQCQGGCPNCGDNFSDGLCDLCRNGDEIAALSGASSPDTVNLAEQVWSKPEYAAADAARTVHLIQDPNDQMGALVAAVDAAIRAMPTPTTPVAD